MKPEEALLVLSGPTKGKVKRWPWGPRPEPAGGPFSIPPNSLGLSGREFPEAAAHVSGGVDRAARPPKLQVLLVGRPCQTDLPVPLPDLPKPEPAVGHEAGGPPCALAARPVGERGSAPADQALIDAGCISFSADHLKRTGKPPELRPRTSRRDVR
jgi:hypothetical protein